MRESLAKDLIDFAEIIETQGSDFKGVTISSLYNIIDKVYTNYAESAGIGFYKNCITGDNDYLLNQLKASMKEATGIDIIVSFLMESGVRLIIDELKKAVNRGVKVRILTGSYLNITQPSALYLLRDVLGDMLDLRLYNIANKSFHPKAYIFEYENDGDIFIGSSNISNSALTSGIEWNYKLKKAKNEKDFRHFKNVFEDLFNNYSKILDEEEIRRYGHSWKKPKVYDEIEKKDELEEGDNIIFYPQPRGAQIEALYELRMSREEGFDKGLVVAATGIGKTYLAAFDSINFKKVLFVAHREEILKQSAATFQTVRQNAEIGFFSSEQKDRDKDIIFASVQTIGKGEYLNEKYFKKDEFDYIIVDEFHHAAANSYQNVLNYFVPDFLLGLTATPERLDNKDVFALCDYNVVYEARLKDAINKGWLVPFRYYGIYDEVDYSVIEYKNGKYNEIELEKVLMINRRAELILKHYNKYKSRRALGFCSSRKHAEYMAEYFCKNGINACSVFSGEKAKYSMERNEALSKLNSGEIHVIFSVDMFNEGIDVPSIDLVMFLRPTESPTIFLQQLGRGLRKSSGKKYLNVLDFIGNYKRANLIPFFLSGNPKGVSTGRKTVPSEEEYPEDCFVDFDFRLIDIFKKQAEEKKKIEAVIYEEYLRIKEYVRHRPTRLEVFTYIDDEIYLNMKKNSKLNILNDYLGFLAENGELNDNEKVLINTKAHEFIKFLETTSMSKSYKMPLLLGFYNEGNLKFKLNEDDIYIWFKSFYSKGSNGIDMTRHKSTRNYKTWGKREYVNLSKENPQKFLTKTNPEFFRQDMGDFCLNIELAEYANNQSFLDNFKDAVDYRTRRYYKERLEEKQID